MDYKVDELKISRVWKLLSVVSGALILVGVSLAEEGRGPSRDAREMAGALGKMRFEPVDWIGVEDDEDPAAPTTFWKDTDGVAPGVAGCHLGQTEAGEPNGRMFGEACLPDGRLVESNPAADKLHRHRNDVGNPDLFDCQLWCAGEGFSSGVCVAAAAPPCEASAKCSCS